MMTICFKDGSFAECEHIEFVDGRIFWDGVRYEWLDDVEQINSDDCEGSYGL